MLECTEVLFWCFLLVSDMVVSKILLVFFFIEISPLFLGCFWSAKVILWHFMNLF